MRTEKLRILPAVRRILAVAVAAAMLAFPAAADKTTDTGLSSVRVSAQSAVLFDTLTGEFLYEKNAEEQRLIASTTKIMTGLVALEYGMLSDVVKITDAHARIEGSRMYVAAGDEYTLEQLLYGLLLMSGNDAALALAEHVGGSVERFVALMNEKAAAIGLSDTHFDNPHGLDSKTHYSSAADMARLAAYALDNPAFLKIVSSKYYQMPGRSMKNHNKLLSIVNGAEGVKTGYTKAAGRCLVSSVTRGGRRLIAVTLNAPSDWDDHSRLYEAAFRGLDTVTYITADDTAAYVNVTGGHPGNVRVAARDSLTLSLRPEERTKAEYVLYLPRFAYAPVRDGDEAGRAAVVLDGQEVASVPLYFMQDVPVYPANQDGFWKNFVKRLANFLGL